MLNRPETEEIAEAVTSNWPCADTLRYLTELNEHTLQVLSEEARHPVAHAAPVFRDLLPLWERLDAVARRRAANCPFMLIDAGFSDPQRWRLTSDGHVADRPVAAYSGSLAGSGVTRLAEHVLTTAWHIAREQPLGAPLFLGMPPAATAMLRACSVREMMELASRQLNWLRPRWSHRPKMWCTLLEAAVTGDVDRLNLARMQGMLVLANEWRRSQQRSR